MMASSLLIKQRRDHIDLLSHAPHSLPEERRRNPIDFETVALHEAIFRSVYRCWPGHVLRIKRALRVPDIMINTRSRHRFDGVRYRAHRTRKSFHACEAVGTAMVCVCFSTIIDSAR
jgi:hypothetical protein